MFTDFPAVLIGGPPHSGKSVLVYSLTQALRGRGVDHYVLRACPDGEGDWSNEANQALVKTIRDKGAYSPTFIDRVVRDLQRRHLPLLVDVGGKPRPWQETVFDHCTHAILLVAAQEAQPGQYEQDMATWQTMMDRHNVPVIARLRSVLHGVDELETTRPGIRGTICGLERGQTAAGPTFDALVARLHTLFAYDDADLAVHHLAQAPAELALDLPALARTLEAPDGRWQPEQLPALRDYLPAGKRLALYGRGPNWIYGTLAMLAHPEPISLFDPRLGWVSPPDLPLLPAGTALAAHPTQRGWDVSVAETAESVTLTMHTDAQYLDFEQPEKLPLIEIPPGRSVILSGRVPHWLLLAAVRRYGLDSRWLALYYPPEDGAVIIHSTDEQYPIGTLAP